MADLTGKGLQLPGDDINLAQERAGSNLAIHLSQDASSNESWRFRIRARTEQGDFELGVVTSRPPARGDPPNRTIAQAFCPGIVSWTVEVRGPDGAHCSVTFTEDMGCCVNGVTAAVIPVNGSQVIITDFAPLVVAAPQGVLMPGPGQLLSFYGFTDPAQPIVFIGLVDKDPAVAVVNGDPWVPGSLVQVPALGGSFALNFPRGMRFEAGAHFAVSTVVGATVVALGGAATVQAERG